MVIFTKEISYSGRKSFEARIEDAAWDAPRVVIAQTFGISKHGPTKGQRLGPADHWTVHSQVRGQKTQLYSGQAPKAQVKASAKAWLEKHAEGLGGLSGLGAFVRVSPLANRWRGVLFHYGTPVAGRGHDAGGASIAMAIRDVPAAKDYILRSMPYATFEVDCQKVGATLHVFTPETPKLDGVRDDVRGIVQAASLLGGLNLSRAESSGGMRLNGRRSTGEHALWLIGRVVGVDPATAAVDIEVRGHGRIAAQPRATDFALQQQVHRQLRVGLEVVLDTATTDEPPTAARRVTLLRIVGVC